MNIKSAVTRFFVKHGSLILTIGASAGVVATSVLTGKAVLKADKILNEIEEKDLKTIETQKKIIPVYIPPVLSCTVTIACIVGCHLMNKKIQAGLIAAYGILDTTFKAYKSKLTVDEEMNIQREIDNDRINAEIEKLISKRPDEEYELWCDDYRSHPYWARKSDILLGKDDLNRNLRSANFSKHYGKASLEEFYAHVKGESEPQDYILGWDIDYLLEEWDDDEVDVTWYDSGLYTDPLSGKQIPCNHVVWSIDPISNFWNYVSIYDRK